MLTSAGMRDVCLSSNDTGNMDTSPGEKYNFDTHQTCKVSLKSKVTLSYGPNIMISVFIVLPAVPLQPNSHRIINDRIENYGAYIVFISK